MTTSMQARPTDAALHDLAQADRHLAELVSELEQTARLATLGTMAAGIVHEINNLLTPVLAYAQLAKANPDDPDLVHKAIDKAAGGAAAACKIAEAILGFARASDTSRTADVNEVLDAALSCIGRDLSRDGIELVRQISPNATVHMESVPLQQVFINLIINAREAMIAAKSSERILTITTHPVPGGRLRIRVADTGPGIPAEIVDRLFEPFVSTKSGNTDTLGRVGTAGGQLCGGSGLGLTVTRHLIQKAGGSITFESGGDLGTTFTITLDAVQSKQHAA